MPLQPRIPAATANAALDAAIGNRANSGFLRIYDGTQPASGGGAITTQNLLAEVALDSDSFAAASGGSCAMDANQSDSSINATGTASWFRLFESDGTTVIMDGSVGTSGCDLNLATVSLVAGAQLTITSFSVSMPLS